jgi:hypothetical protein
MTKVFILIPIFTMLLFTLVAPAGAVARQPLSSGCGGESLTPTNSAYEQQVVELGNQVRLESDCPCWSVAG